MSTNGGHLDRLTSTDASFLTNETSSSHMHIGGLLIFEGPPPPYLDLVDHVRGRLDKVPRFRQRLVTPPLEAGRPLWADDVNFNLKYHIRHTALPEPGGERAADAPRRPGLLAAARPLEAALGDVARPGPRARPVRDSDQDPPCRRRRDLGGGHRNRALRPRAGAEPAPVDDGWKPQPVPSGAKLVARGVHEAAGAPLRLAEQALGAVRRPDSAAQRVTAALEGVGEIVGALADPAPNVPLNDPIGPHRRFVFTRSELATLKRIKDTLGGTVNDVVLAVVTGSLRRWLHRRGIRTEGLELRALVPVSIRTEDERGDLGNRLTVMRGPLPVYLEDPVRRLRVVTQQMEGLKRSKQALGAEVISRFNDFAPMTLLAQASRLNFSTRLFNLIVTNVPGPQIPLYVLGREMEEVFPIAFLPENHGLAVAIISYNGRIGFGLLADYDSMEDVVAVAEGIDDSLAELEQAAAALGAADG